MVKASRQRTDIAGVPTAASVIIPAHNEESIIRQCLDTIVSQQGIDEYEVLVVCNGCTDQTAEIVAAEYPTVRVLECPVASKVAALNMGDEHATFFPKFFIDADVTLSPGCIATMVAAMDESAKPVAAPTMVFDTSQATWAAKQFHQIWQRSPYFTSGNLVGAGFYGISKEARARFDEFPDLLADDMFIPMSFDPHERLSVAGCTFTPALPRRVRDLVRIEIRRHTAVAQFHDEFPEALDRAGDDAFAQGHGWLADELPNPRDWPGIAIYVGVKVWARVAGHLRLRREGTSEWTQDRSTRG